MYKAGVESDTVGVSGNKVTVPETKTVGEAANTGVARNAVAVWKMHLRLTLLEGAIASAVQVNSRKRKNGGTTSCMFEG